jgi:phage FluMu gp28-like protein
MAAGRATEAARAEPVIRLLPYQRQDIESDARFRWNCWARQTGKSFTKSLRRILRGLQRRRTQIFLSAGERQSRELMAKARQHCQALKIATDYYDHNFFKKLSVRQLELVLPGGVRIIGLPANPETARGYTGDVLLDEFAMHADDREIWAAMFPSLLRGQGELDVASTPRGCGNVFYELRGNQLFSTSTVTLADAIEQGLDVDAVEVRRAMNDDLLYRQEFMCEFLDEASAFLSLEQIAACCDPSVRLPESLDALAGDSRALFVGVDVGRHQDLTVIWVLAREVREAQAKSDSPQPTLVTAAIYELAGTPFRTQADVIARLLELRHVRRCCIDAGGLGMQLAEEAVERFGSRRVEAVTLTLSLKSRVAAGLKLAVEGRDIVIPDDPRIRQDWHSVQRHVTEIGHFRLTAPRREGSHADRFWAAALAVRAADTESGEIEWARVKPVQFARPGVW